MSLHVISKSDNIKMYIIEYYLGQKTWIRINRILGGPLLILCGISLINMSKKFAVAYGGFCLIYGVYYLIKPLLFIMMKQSLFKEKSFELTLNEEELHGKNEGIESTYKIDYFQSVVRQPFYYKITMKTSGVIYLITNQLTQEERRILDNHLTT